MSAQQWAARILRAAARTKNYKEEEQMPGSDLTPAARPSKLSPAKNPDISYQLDRRRELADLWDDFKTIHKRHLDDAKWLETFKDKIAEAMGDRTQLYYGDDLLANYARDGQYAWKRFADENPHIAQEYTREVTKEELDTAALLKDHGPICELYRARTFRLK